MSLTEPQLRVPLGVETLFDAGIVAIAFSASGLLAAGLGDGTVKLVGKDAVVHSVQAHDGAVLCLSLDIDGESFVSGGDDGRLVHSSGAGEATELLRAKGRQLDVLAVSRPAKSRAVAVGKEVWLLDAGGAVAARATGHPSTVAGLAFNPKGKRIAAAHYGGVTLWWTATFGHSPQLLKWRGSHIGAIWSPDGKYLMTAMQECELHGWRVSDGEDMAMRGYPGKVRSMDWHAKPPMLATAGSECVIAWPFAGSGPQGKDPIQVAQGIGQLVTRVAVHPARPLVATGFDDGCIAICELVAGRDSRAVRLRGAKGSRIAALAWSPDGMRLAAGTGDGTLSTFDLSGRGA